MIKTGDCGLLIAYAQSYLLSVVSSVRDGTVTVQVLELLVENKAQYLKLTESYEEFKKGSPAPEFCLEERESELSEFKNLREQLVHFNKLTKHFTAGKMTVTWKN